MSGLLVLHARVKEAGPGGLPLQRPHPHLAGVDGREPRRRRLARQCILNVWGILGRTSRVPCAELDGPPVLRSLLNGLGSWTCLVTFHVSFFLQPFAFCGTVGTVEPLASPSISTGLLYSLGPSGLLVHHRFMALLPSDAKLQ